MTMSLNGLRDSLNVKLNEALIAINWITAESPDGAVAHTVSNCSHCVADTDDDSVVTTIFDGEDIYLNITTTYDAENDVFRVHETHTTKSGEREAGTFELNQECATGKLAVEYIIARVCFFIGEYH